MCSSGDLCSLGRAVTFLQRFLEKTTYIGMRREKQAEEDECYVINLSIKIIQSPAVWIQ